MAPALWLLLRLRCLGWARRLKLSLHTARGILFTIFGILVGILCLSSYILSALFTPQQSTGIGPDAVRRYGTLGILAYCLSILVFSSNERAITFTPAEINFLFAGPFSRRQLLNYKIVTTLLASLVGTMVMAVFCRSYGALLVAVFVGLLLATMFLQLFAIAVALLAGMVGDLVYSRGRRVVLAALGVVLLFVAVQIAREGTHLEWSELAAKLDESSALRVITWPLRVYVEAFTAQQVWPDLAQWAGLGVVINLLVLGAIFALDAQSLEVATRASERLYARLQRLRTGGPAAVWGGSANRVRFSLPSLPPWGGAGPIAWRQLLTALRGLKGLLVFLLIIGGISLWPLLTQAENGQDPSTSRMGLAIGGLAMTLILLPSMLTFDFRGDYDRMDVLKALPIGSAALVIGQVMTPVILCSALQLLLLGVGQAFLSDMGWIAAAAAGLLLPFNFLVFSMENLLFLWFPTRTAPMTAGDFQVLGRHMLLFWMKSMLKMLMLGFVALCGAFFYFVTGARWLPTLIAEGCLLVGLDVAMVPLLALAFRQFDVARETPS